MRGCACRAAGVRCRQSGRGGDAAARRCRRPTSSTRGWMRRARRSGRPTRRCRARSRAIAPASPAAPTPATATSPPAPAPSPTATATRAATRWAWCSRCFAASARSTRSTRRRPPCGPAARRCALAEQSVLLEAVTAFGDVVRDTAIVRLRENNVTVLTRDLRATQDRFNVGEVTRTDVAQAQARRAAAVAALDLARANLKTSRATFERVIGHPPSHLVEAARQQHGGQDAGRERRDLAAREPERGGRALPRAGGALQHRPGARRAAADGAAGGQLRQALRRLGRRSTGRRRAR